MTDPYDDAYNRHAKKSTDACAAFMQAELLADLVTEFRRFNDRNEQEELILRVMIEHGNGVEIQKIADAADVSIGRVLAVASDYPGYFKVKDGKMKTYL